MISLSAALLWSAGIGVGGSIFGNLLGGAMNASENKKNRKEAREIDERNFAYQQERDKISDARNNRHEAIALIQNQTNQINDMLQRNTALRDRMVSLWGGGR